MKWFILAVTTIVLNIVCVGVVLVMALLATADYASKLWGG